jgi:hypothetical protein
MWAHFDLPSVRELLRQVANALIDGKSVVLLLPHTIPAHAVRDRIAADLERKRFDDFDHLDISRSEQSPEERLCELFCGAAAGLPPGLRLAKLLQSKRNYYVAEEGHNLPRVLFIDHLDKARPDIQRVWALFLDRWQSATKANRDPATHPCCFCAVADASQLHHLPSDEVWLNIVRWWNVPSHLEMELLSRSVASETGACLTFEQRWRGALFPVLAGGDPGLLMDLISAAPIDVAEIQPVLIDYCKRQGWFDFSDCGLGRDLSKVIPAVDGAAFVAPPIQAMGLWASGILIHSPERGMQVHPAYLCAREYKWLEFFVCQAQQCAFLGFMEQTRFAICREITQSVGDGWALETPA